MAVRVGATDIEVLVLIQIHLYNESNVVYIYTVYSTWKQWLRLYFSASQLQKSDVNTILEGIKCSIHILSSNICDA